jgi:predicted phage terminase large subunit-like protein
LGDSMIPELEKLKPYLQRDQYDPYRLYFDALRLLPDRTESYRYNRELRAATVAAARRTGDVRFVELNKLTYLYSAKDVFEDYLIYCEWNRPPEKKFYMPRRKVLRPLVADLQDLADRKIDFLGISLPPRVGKSTLCIFFLTWLMGRNPDVANVMSGHSDKLTDGFYREVLAIISDPTTYLWADVFPGMKIVETSAKNESIDLNRKKRFPTFTARSIGGTLTGAVEIGEGGCLYVDDLVEDLEESLNPKRLEDKYNAYLNQLKDRKKEGAFELMVGTRWNVLDPLGRVKEQYADNPRYRFTVIPALNDAGESNFDYQYGLGFSTAYYEDMKASIDSITWLAKYMGDPKVREGLLFPAEELRYYNGVLPDGDAYKVAVCDVAWGGGDSLSMPFAYIFGNTVYIHDVIFNRGDKTVTQPIVVGRTKIHRPHKERFEANNGGGEYADAIDQQLRKDGVHVNITARRAPNNQSKMARIIQYSPDIKKFYFISPGRDENGKPYRTEEYQKFMDELTTFSQMGKNAFDDAADSLAQMADELLHGAARIEVGQRPW